MIKVIELLKKSDLISLKKLLKEDPELLQEESEDGESLLALALKERSSMDVIDYLVEQGADITKTDPEGVSILEYALTYGNHDFIKYLLNQGISPHKTQRKSGFTPLMAAVCYNHLELVKLFIEEGVDIFAEDNSGINALEFARRMHRKKILTFLQEAIKEHS